MKSARAHTVPLNAVALAALKRRAADRHGESVFPGKGDKPMGYANFAGRRSRSTRRWTRARRIRGGRSSEIRAGDVGRLHIDRDLASWRSRMCSRTPKARIAERPALRRGARRWKPMHAGSAMIGRPLRSPSPHDDRVHPRSGRQRDHRVPVARLQPAHREATWRCNQRSVPYHELEILLCVTIAR